MPNKIIEAAKFANEYHKGQVRKYTAQPYITHPARVASRAMLLDNATEEMVCTAWLHDVVEDCCCTLDTIENNFGPEVRQYVWELTNPSKGNNLPRAQRKEMDRKHLRMVSRESKQIKLLDRIDNLQEATNAPYNWLKLYLMESKLLLETIGDCDEGLSTELDKIISLSYMILEMEP